MPWAETLETSWATGAPCARNWVLQGSPRVAHGEPGVPASASEHPNTVQKRSEGARKPALDRATEKHLQKCQKQSAGNLESMVFAAEGCSKRPSWPGPTEVTKKNSKGTRK